MIDARRPSGDSSLYVGLIVLLGTGFVDAYTFLRHGHVFAEAMTGNLVLIAVGAARPAIVAFWRPLVAFIAFVVGVAASRGTKPWLSRFPAGHRLGVLALEVVAFGVIGALPSSAPQWSIVVAAAFVSGAQIEAFREIDDEQVTTTVMTSNSMRMIDAIGDAIAVRGHQDAHRREDVHRARTLLISVATFVGGAVIGALCSSWLGNHASWVAGGIFALGAAIALGNRLRFGAGS